MSEPSPSEPLEQLEQLERSTRDRIAKFKDSPRYKDFYEMAKRFEKGLGQFAPACQHTIADPNCTDCSAFIARVQEAWKVEWEAVVRLFPELDVSRPEANK